LHCDARLNEVLPAPEQEPHRPADEPLDVIPVAEPQGEGPAGTAEEAISEGRRCPSCGAGLAASAVLCVKCGYDFRLGKARTTVSKKPKADGRRAPRRERESHFQPVLLGLTLHSTRILLALIATLLIVGLTAYASAKVGVANDPPPWLALGLVAGVGLWLVSITVGFAGSILCLSVPAVSFGRRPLALALVLDVATLPAGVVAILLGWTPLLAWAVGLGSWALFIVFLIRLAAYIDRPSEAQEGRTLLLYGVILIAVSMTVSALTMVAKEASAVGLTIAILLGLAGGLYFRVQFFLYKLLESLRESIRQQLDEARRQAEGVVPGKVR